MVPEEEPIFTLWFSLLLVCPYFLPETPVYLYKFRPLPSRTLCLLLRSGAHHVGRGCSPNIRRINLEKRLTQVIEEIQTNLGENFGVQGL